MGHQNYHVMRQWRLVGPRTRHRRRAPIRSDGGPQARSGNRSWYVHNDSLESIMLYCGVSSWSNCAVHFWLGLLAQLGDVHGLHR